jgi:tRNA-binding EMAP/Myf-like protein
MMKLTAAAYPLPTKATKDADDVIATHRLDIRIGKIVQVQRHPDADAFYVDQFDFLNKTAKFSSGELFCSYQIYQKDVCC